MDIRMCGGRSRRHPAPFHRGNSFMRTEKRWARAKYFADSPCDTHRCQFSSQTDNLWGPSDPRPAKDGPHSLHSSASRCRILLAEQRDLVQTQLVVLSVWPQADDRALGKEIVEEAPKLRSGQTRLLRKVP